MVNYPNATPPMSPTPMPHHKLKKHWRVPMWVIDGDYHICVDKDYIRHFTNKTLPTCIKMKIPFMKSNYVEPMSITVTIGVSGIRWNMDMYICPKELKHLETIGWQYDKESFMLVLHEQDLNSLKGERLDKDNHDTRSKSKKESKANPRRPKLLSFLTSNWRLWKKWCA